ncbi:MAG: acetyltransferase, partial [Acidobacteriota bacterium]
MNPSGGPVRLFGTDMAVFEMREPRQDLPCQVVPTKSALVGFDLRFHAGFEVAVPLRELAGRENLLTILFRVAPLTDPDHPVYFLQKIRVPEIEEEAKGDASLYGAFDLGEGKYRVDWLMRDRAERVCSNFWEVEATLSG